MMMMMKIEEIVSYTHSNTHTYTRNIFAVKLKGNAILMMLRSDSGQLFLSLTHHPSFILLMTPSTDATLYFFANL